MWSIGEMIIGRGKLNCSTVILSTKNPTWTTLELILCLCTEKPVTNYIFCTSYIIIMQFTPIRSDGILMDDL
jgi:hypothetical protein